MFSASAFAAFAWQTIGFYAQGLVVLLPPWALGAGLLGWWVNRSYPSGPRLAGALLGMTFGALVGSDWQFMAWAPGSGWFDHLIGVGQDLLGVLLLAFNGGGLAAAAVTVITFLPVLLALALYLLARRHEDGFGSFVSRIRERRAERREAAAQAAAEGSTSEAEGSTSEAEGSTSEAEGKALIPVRFASDVAPSSNVPTVIQAAGVPVELPAGFSGEDVDKGRVLVLVVKSPADRRRLGGISGFFIGTYYACRTVSAMWLPITAVVLWFFGSEILSAATAWAVSSGINVGTQVLKHVSPF